MIKMAVFILVCTLIFAHTSAFTPSLSSLSLHDQNYSRSSPRASTITVLSTISAQTNRSHKGHHPRQYYCNRELHASPSSSTDGEGSTVEKDDDKEKVFSVEEVAQVIEVSFVQACLQLAQGYVDVQKLFLAAVKSCYDKNVPLSLLLRTVNNTTTRSANRDLTDEEINVRSISMALVYLTLETKDRLEEIEPRCFNNDPGAEGDDENNNVDAYLSGIAQTYGNDIEERVRDSLGMEKKNGSGEDVGASTEKDPMQVALIAHYGKAVISLTMKVVNDEEACYGDGLKGREAKPPIPGAS